MCDCGGAGTITRNPSLRMRWTKRGFFCGLTLAHGIVISGTVQFTFKHPSQYYRLSEVQACKRVWSSGMLHFTRLSDEDWQELMQRDRSEKQQRRLGRFQTVHGRRPMRGVMTVGLKNKGPIKSDQYVEESEIEEADDLETAAKMDGIETADMDDGEAAIVDDIEEWSE